MSFYCPQAEIILCFDEIVDFSGAILSGGRISMRNIRGVW